MSDARWTDIPAEAMGSAGTAGTSPGWATAPRADPRSRAELSDLNDKYDQLMRLADVFDDAGEQLRARARLGSQVLRDPAVAESAELSRPTHTRAEDDIRAATDGRHGLLSRCVELDADALVVRATVLTYRWIDELQTAAYETLGSIAGRAVGYLAPGVALGGAVVSAGLIETDALDRDGVAAYLSELAASNPDLMDHVTGGGGLLDGLAMRSLLTAGFPRGAAAATAARGGMRAVGAAELATDAGSALRDTAAALVDAAPTAPAVSTVPGDAPRTLTDLMATLEGSSRNVSVQRVAPGRYIAFLPGPDGGAGRRLRLVSGDSTAYADQVIRAIETVVDGDPGAHVMLVGSAAGGATAAQLAATVVSDAFTIDQVITAGSPSAHVPRIPEGIRVLSLEDRSDPVALLGSLMSAGAANRVTVVFDGTDTGAGSSSGDSVYVAGGRAADNATHPELRAEITRLQGLGYLTA